MLLRRDHVINANICVVKDIMKKAIHNHKNNGNYKIQDFPFFISNKQREYESYLPFAYILV